MEFEDEYYNFKQLMNWAISNLNLPIELSSIKFVTKLAFIEEKRYYLVWRPVHEFNHQFDTDNFWETIHNEPYFALYYGVEIIVKFDLTYLVLALIDSGVELDINLMSNPIVFTKNFGLFTGSKIRTFIADLEYTYCHSFEGKISKKFVEFRVPVNLEDERIKGLIDFIIRRYERHLKKTESYSLIYSLYKAINGMNNDWYLAYCRLIESETAWKKHCVEYGINVEFDHPDLNDTRIFGDQHAEELIIKREYLYSLDSEKQRKMIGNDDIFEMIINEEDYLEVRKIFPEIYHGRLYCMCFERCDNLKERLEKLKIKND